MHRADAPKSLTEMKPGVVWPAALPSVMDNALARGEQRGECGTGIESGREREEPTSLAGWGRCARRGAGADAWPGVTAGERQTPDPGARVASDANAAPAPTTPPKTETRVRRPRILERFTPVRTVGRRPRQNRSRCSPAGARKSRTELRRLTSVKRLMTSRVSYRRPTVQPRDSRIGYSRWLTRCSRTNAPVTPLNRQSPADSRTTI